MELRGYFQELRSYVVKELSQMPCCRVVAVFEELWS